MAELIADTIVNIGPNHYLLLGAVLFSIGVVGFLVRSNIIVGLSIVVLIFRNKPTLDADKMEVLKW
jgi:NADH:ubiquinone oxidoreductase subunit K